MEGESSRPYALWLNFLIWMGVIIFIWRGSYTYAVVLAIFALALAFSLALGGKLLRKVKERKKHLPTFDEIDFDKIKPSDFED